MIVGENKERRHIRPLVFTGADLRWGVFHTKRSPRPFVIMRSLERAVTKALSK